MGVWLEEPIFSHGQHYVATSWVGDPQHLHLAVNNSVSRKSWNVVYIEILQTGEVVSSPSEVPLICLLLNSNQPRGAIDL